MFVMGPGCVKTLGEKAFAQQWNQTSRRRKTLLRRMVLTRIKLAQNLPGNRIYTAWVIIANPVVKIRRQQKCLGAVVGYEICHATSIT